MTLLERGAIAMATKYGLDWDEIPDQPQYQGVHDLSCKAFWLEMSRAHLEAIREPTEEMAIVGTEARWRSAVRDANNVREIWAAMIDVALGESEK